MKIKETSVQELFDQYVKTRDDKVAIHQAFEDLYQKERGLKEAVITALQKRGQETVGFACKKTHSRNEWTEWNKVVGVCGDTLDDSSERRLQRIMVYQVKSGFAKIVYGEVSADELFEAGIEPITLEEFNQEFDKVSKYIKDH